MGNICTSSANYSSTEEGRPIRNTDRSTNHVIEEYKEIDKWNVDDVYEWLSTVYDGELIDLAKQFKASRIRGRVLDNVTKTQLKEMNVAIGDQMDFEKARDELFAKYNYTSNRVNLPLNPSNSNPPPANSQNGRDLDQQSFAQSLGQHSQHSNGSRDGHPQQQAAPSHASAPSQIPSPMHPRNPSISISNRRSPNHPQHPPQHPPYISYQNSLPTPPASARRPAAHHKRPSIEQSVGRHSVPTFDMPQTMIQPRSSSSRSSPEDINKGPTYIQSLDEEREEDQYAAVEPAFLEGFEQKPNGMMMMGGTQTKATSNGPGGYHKKPKLHKSVSADDCKKKSHTKFIKKRGGKINSLSNPISATLPASATSPGTKQQRVTLKSTKSNPVDAKFMLKIADLLQHTMKKETKTAKEILEILQTVDIENKDENYRRIFQQLIKLKLLNKKPKCTESKKTESDSNNHSEIDHYEFNHSLYKELQTSSPSQQSQQSPSQQLQSNNNDNANNSNNGLHINANGKYCNGVEVIVYSPRSHKWRNGLVLDYNSESKIGKICCYTPMGKQSIKELSLPNPYVKPKMDTMSDTSPMTTSAHIRPSPLHNHPSHPINPSHPQQQPYVIQPNASSSSLQSFGSSPPMTVDGWNNYHQYSNNPSINPYH